MIPVDPAPYLVALDERYGLTSDHFNGFLFLNISGKILRIVAPPMEIPEAPAVDRCGLDFLRIDMACPRPTTAGAMTFARYATRHVIDLTPEQCDLFFGRHPFSLTEEQRHYVTTRGHILVRFKGHGLGLAFLESTRPCDEALFRVRSLYPKAFATAVTSTSAMGNPA